MSHLCKFVVFDLETGGLKTKDECSPITEIAMCVVNSDLTDDFEFTTMIKPYVDPSKYQADALRVSNISLVDCEKKGMAAPDAAKAIVDAFKRAKMGTKKPVLVGHNIDSFDVPILDYFLTMHKIDLCKFVDANFTIDTKWWGRMTWPDNAGFTLSDCTSKMGIDNEQSHRALADTRANKDLFVGLMRRLRNESSNVSTDEFASATPAKRNFKFQIQKG